MEGMDDVDVAKICSVKLGMLRAKSMNNELTRDDAVTELGEVANILLPTIAHDVPRQTEPDDVVGSIALAMDILIAKLILKQEGLAGD